MKSVGGAKVMLRASAAVFAMVLLSHGAMAQDAEIEDPVVDDGGASIGDPVEFTGEDIFIDYEVLPSDGIGDGLPLDEGVPTDEELVYEEGYVDGEILLHDRIGDGEPLDEEALNGEGEEEPVFVSTCDGCELQSGVGGPEVQRDNSPAAVVVDRSGDSDDAVARSSSNACDSGPVSKMWICTVQNGAWRD